MMTLRLTSQLAISTVALTVFASSVCANEQYRLVCTELGITPEAMAAFGIDSVQARSALDRIDELQPQINALRSFQEQHRSSIGSLKQARKNARFAESEYDAHQIEAQIEQLEQDISTLSASIEAQQDLIRASILPSGLNATTIEQVCEPDGFAAFVPVEFRFVSLIESDYTDLLPALAAEQRAIAAGESVDTDTQLTLDRYRNLPTVQTARSHMLFNIDAVRGVFYE